MVLLIALFLLATGCGRPRPVTNPLTPSDLEQLAHLVGETDSGDAALRGGGTGSLSTRDQRLEFSFAALYDSPGWLRVDVRPNIAGRSEAYAAQILVEDECVRMLIPAMLIDVSDCLDGFSGYEPALLFFGLLRSADLYELEEPRVAYSEDAVIITGRAGELRIELTLKPETYGLLGFRMRSENDVWIRGTYAGHGWKGALRAPQTAVLEFGEKGRTRARVRFDFERLRTVDAVERQRHEITAPPGTVTSAWQDLNLWR
ncbi:hypothetical protein K8S17_07345 [bacterium]|nr:hypothetical protein [bacterium]